MSNHPAPACLPTKPGQHAPSLNDASQNDADAHYYRHVLHDLIDMGASLAGLLHQQATTPPQTAPQDPDLPPNPHPAPDVARTVALAASFDRIARAIRRSIALARSLAEPMQPAKDPAQHRAAARKRILREVEDAIQRAAPGFGHATDDESGADDASADALVAELHDRLDAPDLDDDISDRPVADIITEICRDLGLATLPGARPWKRRTPKDLEQHRARAAAPTHTRPPAAGSAPPDGPAEPPAPIVTNPRHSMQPPSQWRPPPELKQTSEDPHR